MSRKKQRVQYILNNCDGLEPPSQDDINKILRAADEIIFVAGRSLLAKILKGSKDKKLLEKELNRCPSYGCFHNKTIHEITIIIDWMITNKYLTIDYNGRLPMIIFTEKGWSVYKPIYVDELYEKILNVNIEDNKEDLIEQLKKTNREIVLLLLNQIGESQNIGCIRFLEKWKEQEVKKVRKKINGTIMKLKSSKILNDF